MPNLIDLFRLSRILSFKDGEMDLMGLPVSIIPISILCDMQKALIDDVGFRRAYQKLYEGAKSGSLEYNRRFIKHYGFKDVKQTLAWQINIVTTAGWGQFSFSKIDLENKELVLTAKNAPFPTAYGEAPYSVDVIPSGFIAGGVSVSAGFPAETFETKCLASGDLWCEFFISTKERVDDVREKFFGKWGL